MNDSEVISIARYVKRLEKIATNYKIEAMRLTEENQRLMRIAELLETAIDDMKDFRVSCRACKYRKVIKDEDYCMFGKLNDCCFEWIHKAEALELLRGEQE